MTHFGQLSDADAQSDAQLEALLARGALDDSSYDPWGQAGAAQGSQAGRAKAAGRCGADGKALRQRRAAQVPASGEPDYWVSAGLRGMVKKHASFLVPISVWWRRASVLRSTQAHPDSELRRSADR